MKISIRRVSTFVLFGVILLFGDGALFAADHAIAVTMDEGFEINGRHFTSGRVSLSEVVRFTPSLVLSEVRVNGESLGMMFAKSAPRSGVADVHSVVFERVPCGHLALIGYSVAGKAPQELQQFRLHVRGGWS